VGEVGPPAAHGVEAEFLFQLRSSLRTPQHLKARFQPAWRRFELACSQSFGGRGYFVGLILGLARSLPPQSWLSPWPDFRGLPQSRIQGVSMLFKLPSSEMLAPGRSENSRT
jgi:hypothetical protein